MVMKRLAVTLLTMVHTVKKPTPITATTLASSVHTPLIPTPHILLQWLHSSDDVVTL
jgi:hypothetical protein